MAVYGYAFAENLLKREVGETERIYRFGPILHHGYVSGIAPYENATRIDRLLLDVRTHVGMSGSPVFDPGSNRVIGIHEAGVGDTVAFAVPLTSGLIDAILAQIRPAFAKEVFGATEGEGEVPYVTRPTTD